VKLDWKVPPEPIRVDVPWFAGEVRCGQMDLCINGATMACGGLVGAIARHPTEPGRLAVLRLLATRRGELAEYDRRAYLANSCTLATPSGRRTLARTANSARRSGREQER